MTHATMLDIPQFIDQQPLSRFQLRTVVLCGVLVFLDGFDAQAMGYVAPVLTSYLHVSRVAIGNAISSGLLGMMFGALLCGPLADRIGRRPVLIGSAVVFGLGALLTSTAGSLGSLILCRVVTGLGLGGAMPNAIALTSEYAPKRLRATAVMTMFTGFSIGAAFGGVVASYTIPRFGWQSLFVIGGLFPLVTAILCFFLLPESIRFLLNTHTDAKKVFRYLSRIGPVEGAVDAAERATPKDSAHSFPVNELFREGRARITSLLWLVFFMNLLDLYFLNSWLPTVMKDTGVQIGTAILVTSLFQVGGSLGAILLGRLLDRSTSFQWLAVIYFGAAGSIFLIGFAGTSVALLMLTISAAGFCTIGGQTGSNALTAEFYPTTIRSTGIGWALGIGRIGSIIGPAVGGAMLSIGGDSRHIFTIAAVPALIAASAASVLAFMQNQKLFPVSVGSFTK